MRSLLAVLALAAALTVAAAASAAPPVPVSMQPLRDAGYTVGVASPLDAYCTVWSVIGHGNMLQVNDCDPDAQSYIDSWTNPGTLYETDFQLQHPDEFQAAQKVATLCYSISRSAPLTAAWVIVGGTTSATVASSDLPAFSASLAEVCDWVAPVIPGEPPAVVTPPVVQITSSGDGTNPATLTHPGDASVTQAIAAQAAVLAAIVVRVQALEDAAAAALVPAAPAAPAAVVTDTLALAADSAFFAAKDAGATDAAAALEMRSAGWNVLYGLS